MLGTNAAAIGIATLTALVTFTGAPAAATVPKPKVTITSGPTVNADNNVSLGYSINRWPRAIRSRVCTVDTATTHAFVSCGPLTRPASNPTRVGVTLRGLADGTYTFTVKVRFKDGRLATAQTAPFTIAGVAPVAILSPAEGLAFASTNVGATSVEQVATLTNSGNAPLIISSRVLGGVNPGDFVLGATTCGATLAAGASCTTSIGFRPTAAGSRAATFVVTDDATDSPRSVPLTGTGVAVGPDTVSPTVSGRTPAVNATDVDVAADVTATFSEEVNGVSDTTATIRNGTVPVAATVTYDAATRMVTISPTSTLLPDTTYTVTLTGGTAAIRDLANNPMTSTSWSFHTAT